MRKLSPRLRVFIGVAVVLALIVVGRFLFFGGQDTSADSARGPEHARIEQLRQAKDLAGLGTQAAHTNERVARLAVGAMGRLGAEAVPKIERALEDKRPRVRERAATAYAQAARHDQAAPLAKLVREDASPNVRAAAVAGLGRLCAFDEMESILAAMDDPDVAVRRRASKAATRIACVIVGYQADDPVAKRHAAIRRMRAHWAKERGSARQYWMMILKNREAKKTN